MPDTLPAQKPVSFWYDGIHRIAVPVQFQIGKWGAINLLAEELVRGEDAHAPQLKTYTLSLIEGLSTAARLQLAALAEPTTV